VNVEHIRIRQVKPKGPSVVALAGDGFAVPVGDGGWTAVARPRRRGFLEWAGLTPLTMDVPIVLDGYAPSKADNNRAERFYDGIHDRATRLRVRESFEGKSIEADIRALEAMHRKPQGPLDQPPVIEVVGATVPHRGTHWVLNGLTPGEVHRRDSDGARVRMLFTLNLMEYLEPDVLTKSSPAKRQQDRNRQRKDNRSRRTYRVKKGDTLGKIAVAIYSERKRWHDIARLNDIRDPKSSTHLKVGRVLKLP
jgi:hypothetical protein